MEKTPEKHRGIPWSEREISKLVSLYDSGIKIDEISRTIGRSNSAIDHKINGLRSSRRREDWMPEEISKLLSLRASGMAFKKIGELLGRTERSVQGKHVRMVNCKTKQIKTKNATKNNRRVYSCNDSYFSIIDSQRKAYYIGWLLTDGYVGSMVRTRGNIVSSNKIGLKLALRDIDVLDGFKNDLEASAPIKTRGPRISMLNGKKITNSGSCSFEITSKQLRDDLAKYGVIPNKTYVCKFPERLEEMYYPGFVAGAISGDGSVSVRTHHNRKSKWLRSSFSGTKDLVLGVRSVLVKNIEYNPDKSVRTVKGTRNLHTIELSHTETLALYVWLKNNNVSLMHRKNKIVEDYINNNLGSCRGVA
jgi:hypothetical protein